MCVSFDQSYTQHCTTSVCGHAVYSVMHFISWYCYQCLSCLKQFFSGFFGLERFKLRCDVIPSSENS